MNNPHNAANPAKGYYTIKHLYGFFSDTTDSPNTAWWMINLKEKIYLDSVRVATMVEYGEFNFKNVVFRFGNSSNYSNNIEVGREEIIKERFPVYMKASVSILGQYLSLESKDVTFLGFGTIVINEKP